MIAGASVAGLPSLAAGADGSDSDENATARSGDVEPSAPELSSEGMESTLGLGLYPGDPRENFSPELVIDGATYRNLALLRPAYHSSSYDYNLTAQLITDGIKDTRMPNWVVTSVGSRGPLPKNEREAFLDHFRSSFVELRGQRVSVQIQLSGGETAPDVDRVDLIVLAPGGAKPEDLTFAVSVSDDGREWTNIGSVQAAEPTSTEGYPQGFAQPGQLFTPAIPLSPTSRNRFYQVECEVSGTHAPSSGMQWRMVEVAFLLANKRVEIGGPYSFTSAWMSAGLGEEWVYVDLGAMCEFDRVSLFWISRAAEGSIQVSDDAEAWREIASLPTAAGLVDDIRLTQPACGQYVRVLMQRPTSTHGYILSELEVYGRGARWPSRSRFRKPV
jgi:hypothetical protein